MTLEGELEWNYQKEAARDAVKNLLGVMGVSNIIAIKSEARDLVEEKEIENAIRRNWAVGDQDIMVKVSGHKVTLSGSCDFMVPKEEAARIVWNAPGVWTVDNELVIEYDYEVVD